MKRECAVTVYSDSNYMVDGVSKGWAIKWKRSGGVRAEIVDLWVEGHDGHQENGGRPGLLEDAGYTARGRTPVDGILGMG